jgi:hypothetical protein
MPSKLFEKFQVKEDKKKVSGFKFEQTTSTSSSLGDPSSFFPVIDMQSKYNMVKTDQVKYS